MTESEWLNGDDPRAMLRQVRKTASERQLRLFSCACCRRIWHLLVHPFSRWAVETMERVVEGQSSRQERVIAESRAGVVFRSCNDRAPESVRISGAAVHGVWAALGAAFGEESSRATNPGEQPSADSERIYAWRGAESAIEGMRRALVAEAPQAQQRKVADNAVTEQCGMILDVFGNPFRPATLDSSWLSWNDGTIPALALGIYEERAFERMPILGDALEEAGCTHREILDHCRIPRVHIRGCWLVDLILGRY